MVRCAAFDGGIKICRSVPLDFLCSAGFLDHRAILLAVMGLTENAGNGICNWCLFSMHLRPAYPLAFLACPLPPAPWVNPGCLSPCPLITTTGPGVLPAHCEVKQLGQGTVRCLQWPLYDMVKNHTFHSHFHGWANLMRSCYWLWMMKIWLSFSALNKIICVYAQGNCIHVQLKRNSVHSYFRTGWSWKTQIVAEFGFLELFIYWDYLVEKVQKTRIIFAVGIGER